MPEIRARTRSRSKATKSPSPSPAKRKSSKTPERGRSKTPERGRSKTADRKRSKTPERSKTPTRSRKTPDKSRAKRKQSPEPKPSPSTEPEATLVAQKAEKREDYAEGTNWVSGGVEDNAALFGLVCVAPFLTVLLGYLTSEKFNSSGMQPFISELGPACFADLESCGSSLLSTSFMIPDFKAVQFILCFMAVGVVLELLPGKIEVGPETLTGHVPKYTDNGVKHCIVYTFLFYAGSNLGWGNYYDFGIFFDVFPESIAFLNIFGILFCLFLTCKGLTFPSTADCGSSGSFVKDFLWGTELYPRIFNWDLKRFINCRFSMTYWQLAGLSYAYKSYTLHGEIDYGLLLAAISQYVYLFKFFWWEMGYMRSIDIIVDRAGFEIQWGCLVWVPAVYTLHSRFCVLHPTGYSFAVAGAIFVISILGVILNYAADRERDIFRATNGQALVWGKKPIFIEAEYSIIDRNTGEETKKKSLLLASGFWGTARHFQYFFELQAAWSWCLLANPFKNGVIPLFYAAFLTYLLIDRANRDSKKCHLKYGKHYEEYCRLVPYKIVPGVY